jgi:hypothetical protein
MQARGWYDRSGRLVPVLGEEGLIARRSKT